MRRSAGILEVEIDDAGAEAIAARSRGTPRVANRLLKRVRDFAEVRGAGHIDARVAREALDLLEVDEAGLDRLDRDILRAICEKFGGGPVGLSTLAVAVGEEPTRSRTSTSPTCSSRASSCARRAGGWPRRRRSRTSASRRRAAAPARSSSSRPRLTCPLEERLTYERSMPIFICPNCGDRSVSTERTAGFQNRARACKKCGFGFLFELLDDYYPAPNAAFFLLDQQGRLIGTGRGARELTGPGRPRRDRPPGARRARASSSRTATTTSAPRSSGACGCSTSR